MTTTTVYRYGIAAPHDGANVVLEQMRHAHAYERDLVAIERGRRAAERTIRTESNAALRALEIAVSLAEERCERLAQAVRDDRRRSRKRSETVEARADLATARSDAKVSRNALYELRRSLQPQCAECRKAKSEEIPCAHASPEARALRTKLDALDALAADLRRGARALSGLYWGTYLVVERAMRASFAMPLYGRDGVSSNDPRMPPFRWDGRGTVAIHAQGSPLTVARATSGASSLVHITPSPWPEEWLSEGGSSDDPGPPWARRPGFCPDGARASTVKADGTPARWVHDHAARHGELRMRVGVNDEYASWRLDYHRPLPPKSTISWVCVHRRMRGPHPEWSATVTVEGGSGAEAHASSDTVAIDIGWRQMPDGSLRVAGWADSLGGDGELRLSPQDIRALRQCEEIRSRRSMAYDVIRASLKRWVDTSPNALEWMRDLSSSMHAWRSQARLVSLLARWKEEVPVPNDYGEAVVRAAVEAWAHADYHAWEMETSRQTWSLRRRSAKYGEFAAEMTKRYGTVILEKFDLRDVAGRVEVGSDVAENERARSNRQVACVSDLRTQLRNACRKRGTVLTAVPAADSTRTCPACGVVEDRDAAAQVRLACETCGHTWDQDTEGAAPVLLARYREHSGAAKILEGARHEGNAVTQKEKGRDRWARARRMGAAKKARIQTAREAAGETAE